VNEGKITCGSLTEKAWAEKLFVSHDMQNENAAAQYAMEDSARIDHELSGGSLGRFGDARAQVRKAPELLDGSRNLLN
jgi:ABC-type thiamine transport system ATPase subunit